MTIGGRISDAAGKALARVSVSLTDGSGATRTALSNSFGNYHFTDVPASENYVISVNSKRYNFSPNTQILFVGDDLEEINFTADKE